VAKACAALALVAAISMGLSARALRHRLATGG
jgi:hypothetical protein